MTRFLSVALPAGLAALGLCGCVIVAKPRPTTAGSKQGDRPVYVVVQKPQDSPPDARTTHDGPRTGPPAQAPPPVWRRQFKYRYYPLARVYFAPDRGRYYWLTSHGWRVGTRLPGSIEVEGEVPVDVTLDSDVPYTLHANVEAAHPGRGRAKP